MASPKSVEDVVENGLCIGCGLCEAMAPACFKMVMSDEGRLRPARLAQGDEAAILSACPGAVAEAPAAEDGATVDPIWGAYSAMGEAWAGDPEVRFKGATGGVLTALGQHLLRTGLATFILHVGADPDRPMRSRWIISESADDVLANAGSRYGPTDTLAGLEIALSRGQPFAVIAKPCDAGAIYARAKADPRINEWIVAILVMVCGGASDLGKSRSFLEDVGVSENDVRLFRYRGHGNPGATRVETGDGRAFETTYNALWEDEGSWRIQTRCKICPDALGEAADIAALDIWPGGSPVGEDDGFNGMIVRTGRGAALVEAAVAAGDLVLGAAHSPRDLDDFQPHQVSKKHAVSARLRGMAASGAPVYSHNGLRLEALDQADPSEEAGTAMRVKSGRFAEEMPKLERK